MDSKQNTYYIGDLARALGLSQRTIRYYEEMGLIKPSRTEGGFRTYTEHDAGLLRMVLRFRDLGMSLDEIRALLLPSEDSLTSDVMGELRETLKARRADFELKLGQYRESISQIDEVLKLLSPCTNCGEPAVKGVCKNCLKGREENGEDVAPIISSLLSDGRN